MSQLAPFTGKRKPLVTFCFNQGDIWEQDMWNNQLFNRHHDILAQRTNQIQPFPESTGANICFTRVQEHQNRLDKDCCPRGYPLKMKYLAQPDDYHSLTSQLNTHYLMDYPKHQMNNIRDLDDESRLKTLGDYLDRDNFKDHESQWINNDKKRRQSNQSIYRDFHQNEVKSMSSRCEDRFFDNTTKEIYNTTDKRNQMFPPQVDRLTK